jgi:HlyD family secretion protein
MWKLVSFAIGLPLLAIAIIAAPERDAVPAYELANVSRGQSLTKVVAAGTVQPVISVVVGSQVSGQVKEILVDHNDRVKQGQPIAVLDPELFNTHVEQARAEVEIAKEAVRIAQQEMATAEAVVNRTIADRIKAQADTQRYEVAAKLAHQRFDRKSLLIKSGAVSTSEAEDARAAYDTALADLQSAEAQVSSQDARVHEAKTQLSVAQSRVSNSEAQVRHAQAALHRAKAELDRTVIRAPMNGIVIDRSVTAGQTVAASFQAPTLFTIGDLHSVNVEIAIDEADIGGLKENQRVTFSVDAYPDKTFAGWIAQIRKSPHTQESVVTYTVVATANNNELLLFPGMTAKAEIITADVPDALQVPSAALRYRPKHLPQPSGSHVWVFESERIWPVAVKAGVSNEGKTEITGRDADLTEGQTVVVADGNRKTASSAISRVVIALAGLGEPLRAALAGSAKD